jgi:hypothetical protein
MRLYVFGGEAESLAACSAADILLEVIVVVSTPRPR